MKSAAGSHAPTSQIVHLRSCAGPIFTEGCGVDLVAKQRIITGGAIAGALVIGWQIAEGTLGWVAVIGTAGLLLAANIYFRLAADALIVGLIIVGYLIGNRGFAQLHPPNLPLLPAETALLLGVSYGVWRCARSRRLPVGRDALNVLLFLWLVLAAVRLPMDFRRHGFVAIRDFAMVYYALFFFLGQLWGEDRGLRDWLLRCFNIGFAFTVPAFWAFNRWPEWFGNVFTLGGTPLIFIKSDVAGGFMAAGFFWFGHRYCAKRHVGWLTLCVLSLIGVGISNSRAASVALIVGAIWLILLRAWKMLAVMGALSLAGLIGLAGHAVFSHQAFSTTPLYRGYESAASIVDFNRERTYQSEALGDKSDNNQFRLVWWRTVIAETLADGPTLGLGFGHDLASEFSRIYYADANDDFSARSPHNYLLSVLARTGVVGLTLMLLLIGVLARETWRARRTFSDNESILPLWLACWMIMITACFGVVLEGPMGAVVFWTTLGLANAATKTDAATAAVESSPTLDPILPSDTEADQLTPAS